MPSQPVWLHQGSKQYQIGLHVYTTSKNKTKKATHRYRQPRGWGEQLQIGLHVYTTSKTNESHSRITGSLEGGVTRGDSQQGL